MKAAIHCRAGIGWQAPFAKKMQNGLKAIGIDACIIDNNSRIADIAILLGTTAWHDIEADGGEFLLVDRASFGDPEYVSLVWNGHGRRGNHKVPEFYDDARWNAMGFELQEWQPQLYYVLCGQHEPYSPRYATMKDWYDDVTKLVELDFYRPHPAIGDNPLGLPIKKDFKGARAVTLNSSVAFEFLLRGQMIEAWDEGSMAYEFNKHMDREQLFIWVAWTQWHHDEIAAGEPIRHLFE